MFHGSDGAAFVRVVTPSKRVHRFSGPGTSQLMEGPPRGGPFEFVASRCHPCQGIEGSVSRDPSPCAPPPFRHSLPRSKCPVHAKIRWQMTVGTAAGRVASLELGATGERPWVREQSPGTTVLLSLVGGAAPHRRPPVCTRTCARAPVEARAPCDQHWLRRAHQHFLPSSAFP